jgi:hypothetical protein
MSGSSAIIGWSANGNGKGCSSNMGDIDYRNGEWLTFIPACAIPAISGFGTRRGSERRSDLSLRISAAHFFTPAGAPQHMESTTPELTLSYQQNIAREHVAWLLWQAYELGRQAGFGAAMIKIRGILECADAA